MSKTAHPNVHAKGKQACHQAMERSGTLNLFPIILDRDSAPWGLGYLYILSRLEGVTNPSMTTFHRLADDLRAFKAWIDDHDNSEQLIFDFRKFKLRRVTYRYCGALNRKIAAGEVAASTANRRMGTVDAGDVLPAAQCRCLWGVFTKALL